MKLDSENFDNDDYQVTVPHVVKSYVGIPLWKLEKMMPKENLTILRTDNDRDAAKIIEIRLRFSTLALVIKNNYCTEAYVFKDRE